MAKNPALEVAFQEYQSIYQDIQALRKRTRVISEAIYESVDNLVDFIMDELRKYNQQ